MGVKSVLPFSKLIIGKSQVFSAYSHVYLSGYTQICDGGGGTMRRPPRPHRVKWYLYKQYAWRQPTFEHGPYHFDGLLCHKRHQSSAKVCFGNLSETFGWASLLQGGRSGTFFIANDYLDYLNYLDYLDYLDHLDYLDYLHHSDNDNDDVSHLILMMWGYEDVIREG